MGPGQDYNSLKNYNQSIDTFGGGEKWHHHYPPTPTSIAELVPEE